MKEKTKKIVGTLFTIFLAFTIFVVSGADSIAWPKTPYKVADLMKEEKKVLEHALENEEDKSIKIQKEIQKLKDDLARLIPSATTLSVKNDLERKIDEKNAELEKLNIERLIPLRIAFNAKKNTVDNLTKLEKQEVIPDAQTFFGSVIDLLVLFVGIVSFVLLVVTGFRMIIAAGNEQEIQLSKGMLEYAITGLVVALAAYFIISLVRGIFYS